MRRIRDAGLTTPVLMLSARGRTPDIVRGLESGADDYLPKPFVPEELQARAHALIRRSRIGEAGSLALGELVLDRRAGRAMLRGVPVELSGHELRLLDALLSRAGQVVPRAELLTRAWDAQNPPTTATLDPMMGALRNKLRAGGVDIVAVRGQGYEIVARTPGFQEDEGFRTLFFNAAAGIALLDATGGIVQTNPALGEILGYAADELRGREFASLAEAASAGAAAQSGEAYQHGELRLRRRDGTLIWALVSRSEVRSGSRAKFFLAMVLDITERKRAEEALQRLSLTDELTGLYNRRGLLVLADQQWRLARRKGERLILIYADLDGFKGVNDTFGHEVGDRLLKAAADVLRAACRESDTVARLGGDEFVILAAEAAHDKLASMTDRIRAGIEAYNASSGSEAKLAASLGVVTLDPDDGSTLEELLVLADRRMYEEKRRRGSRRGDTPQSNEDR